MFPVESIIYNKGKSIYVEKKANESCVLVMSGWYPLSVYVGGGICVFIKFGVTFINDGSILFISAEHIYRLFF